MKTGNSSVNFGLFKEKEDDIDAKLEHSPRKVLSRLAQETGVSKSSTRAATELKQTETSQAQLQPCNPD
jgi:hypothetical protein